MFQSLVLEFLVSCVFTALGLGRWERLQSRWLHQAFKPAKSSGVVYFSSGLVCGQDCVDEGESPAHFTLGAVFALSWGSKAALSAWLYLFHPSQSKRFVSKDIL